MACAMVPADGSEKSRACSKVEVAADVMIA